MTKMTSAYANKMLKKLKEDLDFYIEQETEGQSYIAALDEEPLVPEYDYAEISAKIAEINEKVVIIKHAINVVNTTCKIDVNGVMMTVDSVLIRMAQLNKRKYTLDAMRKRQKKERVSSGMFISKKTSPEYRYINYDLDCVHRDYDRIDNEISVMQIALDKFNQTYEFDVDI